MSDDATFQNDKDYVGSQSKGQAKDMPVPVVRDSDNVESGVNPATEDSDQQLEKDDADAIDESNIIDERTRGAAKPEGTYSEPDDTEGLPEDDGTSNTRG